MKILEKKTKIQQIVNVFETGIIKGDYSNISIFNDGPNRCKQVTYGKSQTTEFGNLKKLIDLYINNKGKNAQLLQPYVLKIGVTPLHQDIKFIQLLKESGKDPIMISTQDIFFDTHYWLPAIRWCNANGIETPLGGLVIYDSYIHSGSILSFLRNKFQARVPIAGGKEDIWIIEYLNARKAWLSNHSNQILTKTVYRVNNMLNAVSRDDWELLQPFNSNGIIVV